MKKYFALLLVMSGYLSEAQNNSIFNGGVADGADRNGFAQAESNRFVGSIGDGWQFSAFAQGSNNIFAGGNGDGWSFFLFAQPANAIYNGGVNDGWSYLAFLQAANNVFIGGQGDGWASTYRALGPLPVTFSRFEAEKRGAEGLLSWETATERGSSHFVVERSADAVRFSTMGTVAAAGNSSGPRPYQFVDARPLNGANYYRLKQVDLDGKFVYTPTRLLTFNEATLRRLAVYPVPTAGLLTVDIPEAAVRQNALLNISNAAGVMVQQIRLVANSGARRVIDLNGLPAGTYTVQLVANGVNETVKVIKQ